ncbi:MAG: RNA-dependent RNA polymerase [Hangzhou eysarcoris guttigerus lispivirus 1]|uniref:RNA-directed RNA polymerase L n=1 Tax=Hangzhou eysarcoris guttigerus lispivirus 1 TaxID=2905567 RepID=A0A8K1XCJ2_9MONO|nr:MAG: RNA-dependent RNA polymerase [Hangzhou eysarcoris guttigerus lispivirus 1]UHK03312.1 MAG: RNA-dependent RNA polymerase [Hangzhou eysarcoris guttigerus lispivirus 1]
MEELLDSDVFNNRDKPFLPDIHLKSAITKDYIDAVAKIMEDQNLEHPDRNVNIDARNALNGIKRRYNKLGLEDKNVELIILSGLKSVFHYPSIWGRRTLKSLKPSIKDLCLNSWNKFNSYWEMTKDLLAVLIKSSLGRKQESILKDEILKGLKDKFNTQSASAEDMLYTSYASVIEEICGDQDRISISLIEKISSLSISRDLIEFFITLERLNFLRCQLIHAQVRRDEQFSQFNLFCEYDVLYNQNLCMYWINANEIIMLDINQVLMISDNSTSRFLSLLTSSLYIQSPLPRLPNPSLILQIYGWMDSVISKLGNPAYGLIKQLESLCIAVYLVKFDPLTYSHKFLDSLVKDNNPNEIEYLKELISILKSVSNPNELFELYGLYRHGGHPIVDEVEGCLKMKTIAREKTKINKMSIMETLGACKKNFIIEYLVHNKHWPQIDIETTCYFIHLYKEVGDKFLIISDDWCRYNPVKFNKPNNSLVKDMKQHIDNIRSFRKFKVETPNDVEKISLEDFKELVIERPNNINEYDKFYPVHFWALIQFSKNFEYNDYEDFTNLLSDTAISPDRNHWTALYKGCLLRKKHPFHSGYSRRTLINVLQRNNFSMEKVRTVISTGQVPQEWKIISVHSKERELKIASRLFAMMVLEMRMYFSSTEKNLSDSFFKYVPTQTMTSSEAELTQKLLTLTNINTKQTHIAVMVSCDIDKFNMRWRKQTTNPFFKFIDDLFGTPDYYTYSHEFFEQVLVCLASNYHPPEYLERKIRDLLKGRTDRDEIAANKILDSKLEKNNLEKESNTTWIGQGGGFEGLRQKGWTFIMASILQVVEERTNFRSYIIGQGDNQFIVVLLPMSTPGMMEEMYIKNHQEHIADQIQFYLSTLENVMIGLGMVLKKEETWCSTKLLCYGKEILVEGCYTTSILKRASRAYSEVNEVYPTISTRISSVFSSCHSVASKSFEPLIPYSLAVLLTAKMLDDEISGRGLSQISSESLSVSLKRKRSLKQDPVMNAIEFIIFFLLNKEIGGYPILPITEFLYRGHPDPVNNYFSILSTSSDCEQMLQVIQYILISYKDKKEQINNYKKLIQDPTCLNWKTEHVDTGVLSRILEDNLKINVKNEDIRILLNTTDTTAVTEFIKFLETTKPFIPRVLNEIYRHSPEGAKLNYLSTFSDMKTMKEMMSANDGKNFIQIIENQETTLLKDIFFTINKIKNIVISKEVISEWNNSFLVSEKITKEHWDKDIDGSRIPHPLQQSILVRSINGECLLCAKKSEAFKEHISFVFNSDNLDLPRDEKRNKIIFSRGPFNPYLGSTTREKRSRSLINFKKGDKALLAVQSLQRIRDWVIEPESELDKFVESIIKSRTDLPIQIVQLGSGKLYGGSVVHRFQDVITKHSCRPNSRPNIFSHIYLTSDTMGKYSSGKENYNIHFQSGYLYGLSIINLLLVWDIPNSEITYHLHYPFHHSIKKTDLDKVTTSAKPPTVKKISNCRLLFSTVNEYVDKRVEFEFGPDRIISPENSGLLLKEGAHFAASTIIYSHFLDAVNPIIQIHNAKQNPDITSCPLTIDDLLQLSIRKVMEGLGTIWYYDNVREIYRRVIDHNVSVEDLIYHLISTIPTNSLKLLRCVFGHESVRDRLIKEFGWPTSNQFITSAYGLDRLFTRSIFKGAIKALQSKSPLRLLFPYGCMKINRCIQIFLYSLLNTSLSEHPYALLKYIDIVNKGFYQLIDKQKHNMTNYLSIYYKLATKDKRITNLKFPLPKISSCGCEPWIRKYKNTIKNNQVWQNQEVMFRVAGDQRRILIESSREFRIRLSEILEEDEHSIDYTYNRSELILLDDQISFLKKVMNVPDQKERVNHSDRLTGLYSTAHGKYGEIIVDYVDSDYDNCINLAEGAGGVAKLTANLFAPDVIIYDSLLDLKEFLPQKALSYVPPELLGTYWHKEGKILGIQMCLETGGDLKNPEVVDRLIDIIEKNCKGKSLLTFDAELGDVFKWEDTKNLITSVSRIIKVLHPKSLIILKTFFYYITVFEVVLAALVRSCGEVRVVKPKLSSNENTEVFLIIEKSKFFEEELSFNYRIPSHLDRKFQDIQGEDRLDIQLEKKTDLHMLMNEIGFEYNLSHALMIITNGIINLSNFYENPLREIATYIDLCIIDIQQRFALLGKSLSNKNLSTLETTIRKINLKESEALYNIGTTFINLIILRELFIYNNLDISYIYQSVDVHYPDAMSAIHNPVIYTIRVHVDKWVSLYPRSFQKVLGYLNTPNMWELAKDSHFTRKHNRTIP